MEYSTRLGDATPINPGGNASFVPKDQMELHFKWPLIQKEGERE
jgi:hypothetical protein